MQACRLALASFNKDVFRISNSDQINNAGIYLFNNLFNCIFSNHLINLIINLYR